MATANRYPWARPIVFEGVELPGTAIAIDHLGKEPEMSEAASAWLWRFTICVGVINQDSADNVIKFATEAMDIATRFRERLLREVPARFFGPFDERIIDDWTHSLQTIIEIARTRRQCSWTAPEIG